ncbi:MAG: glycosyltransferase [Rhodoferax sp.]|nr:glycosyltransferase [Rhodoferax sp.]MCP5262189.1 glycosyltransferase [Rhodoferax sp.]
MTLPLSGNPVPGGAGTPRVSVILNIRNGAATLDATLRSLMDQTFTDWELVAWDDGSTDGSAAKVAALADPRVHVHASTAPSHLGAARRQAMAQARGQWLAFLDQDDVWLAHKLEQQMALDEPGVDLIYCRTLKMFELGGRCDFDHRHEHVGLPEGDIFMELVERSCFICMSSALLRREALQRAGELPDWVHVAPDYWLFLALSRSGAARAVQEPLCLYRVHAGGMTAASLGRIQDEAIMMLEHWRAQIPAPLLARRLQVHHTVGAYVQLLTAGQRLQGWRRLLQQGSLPYLLSRPPARAWRALRRRWRAPQWQHRARQAGLLLPTALDRGAA